MVNRGGGMKIFITCCRASGGFLFLLWCSSQSIVTMSLFNPFHKHDISLESPHPCSLKRVYKTQQGNKPACCTPLNLVVIVEIGDGLKIANWCTPE